MKRFLYRLTAFLTPFLFYSVIGLVSYFYFDPFMVLKSDQDFDDLIVTPNLDFLSTEKFLTNNVEKHYNSFILGSSRAIGYRIDDWKIYLDSNAIPYVFNAYSESILGIYQKLNFLNENNVELKNVIIIICPDVTFSNTTNFNSHTKIKDYRVSGESKLFFHLSFIKGYFDPIFMTSYLGFKVFKKSVPWNKGVAVNGIPIRYDPVNNMTKSFAEDSIRVDSIGYYKRKIADGVFKANGQLNQRRNQILGKKNLYLSKIKELLKKQKTNYKIIISPLYDGVTLSNNDYEILKELFEENLYDFSGVNEITSNPGNYYEANHFRPHIGRIILSDIYNK